MNKNIIALAVAAAVAAPAAFAEVKIGGVAHYSWDFVDTSNAAPADDSDDSTGKDRFSRIRFSGSEDLGNGLSAFWQVESQVNANGGAFGHRNTFAGLKGGWGQVRLGRHDTPYKMSTGSLDVFGDTMADYNTVIGRVSTSTTAAAGNTNAFDLRVPQTVAYITPSFNGFTGAIARVSGKVAEAAGDETEAWSMMGTYSNGPIFAALAYETHSAAVETLAGTAAAGASTAAAEFDAWKLGVGYKFGSSKIGLVYEDTDHDTAGAPMDRSAWVVNFAHSFGANTLKASYGTIEDGDAAGVDDGMDTWAIGIDHAFSKRTSIYAIYATVDNDTNANFSLNGGDAGVASSTAGATAGNDVDGLSFGLKHTF